MLSKGLNVEESEKYQPRERRQAVVAIFGKQPHLFRLYSTLACPARRSASVATKIEAGATSASRSSRLSTISSATAARTSKSVSQFDFIIVFTHAPSDRVDARAVRFPGRSWRTRSMLPNALWPNPRFPRPPGQGPAAINGMVAIRLLSAE